MSQPERFYISHGTIVHEYEWTLEMPDRCITRHSDRITVMFTNAPYINRMYGLPRILPMLKIPDGSCWLVEVDTSENETIIRIVDRNVKCETFLY